MKKSNIASVFPLIRFIVLIKLFMVLFAFSANAQWKDSVKWPSKISTIAFGSCAKERLPQPIWNEVAKTDPDLFLFIGDNQYADVWVEKEDGSFGMAPVDDPARFAEAYNTLASIPEFAAFRSSVPFMGTWDDHDYGKNDGGKEYEFKSQSQSAFLDFFNFTKDAPIRSQEGIYHSKTFGEAGQKVQVIMLDTRYHRDPIDLNPLGRPENRGPYVPSIDTSRSMLGDAQWQWLEKTLKEPADVRLLVSSIQVVAYEHQWETWGNLPHERQRLYDLIAKTQANGVILLSGDRHLTEISVDKGQKGAKVPYPIWDFTASGMTDAFSVVNEDNTFRVGGVFRQSHFGTLDFEWHKDAAKSKVIMTVFNEDGDVLNKQSVTLAELSV